MPRLVLWSLLACLGTLAVVAGAPAAGRDAPRGGMPRDVAPLPGPTPGTCARYGQAQLVGTVPPELPELSGFAASHLHPGIFWAHNDSGHRAELYAMREDGTVVATLGLVGVHGLDPEDVAVGPCDAGAPRSCIYLGDIGDNGMRREHVSIVRLPEPERLESGPVVAEVLPYRYPDGPRNVEALVVDPRTARAFVISKTLVSLGDVYRLDALGRRGGGSAVRVRRLRLPREFDSYTTGADVHPLGDRMLLRTYGRVWEFRSRAARSLEDVLDVEPVEVPGASQPQAEAVAYLADGRGYLLGSENAGSPIYRVDCAPGGSGAAVAR